MKKIDLTDKEWERISILGHKPNSKKTDAEFIEWCDFAKKLGFPTPNRNSNVRSLHETKQT